jgi:hypothetical protein
MATEKLDPSAVGFASLCLHGHDHFVDQKPAPCFFWH